MVRSDLGFDEGFIPFGLGSVRRLYRTRRISFSSSVDLITRWRDNTSYLCFKRQDLKDDNVDYVHMKASKRGNDVYRWRVYCRHKDILDFCQDNEDFKYIRDSDNGFVSNVLKFTLTVSEKDFDFNDFNKNLCSRFYDKFRKRVENNFGSIDISRSYEVSENGLLHVNVVIVFQDQDFPVYRHVSKIDGSVSWRLRDRSLKNKFNDLWDPGFVDVRSVLDNHDLLEYVLKYHIKYFTKPDCRRKQELTLSVLSLFNKRCCSMCST
jgi:hypothetical protein